MSLIIGKREFLHQASHYLKEVEQGGKELVITNHGTQTLRISPVRPKSIKDLRGIIPEFHSKGDLNDPVLPGYGQW